MPQQWLLGRHLPHQVQREGWEDRLHRARRFRESRASHAKTTTRKPCRPACSRPAPVPWDTPGARSSYSEDRLLYPMKRVGEKGAGKGHFERISWDEALDTIAGKMKQMAEENPDNPWLVLLLLRGVRELRLPVRILHAGHHHRLGRPLHLRRRGGRGLPPGRSPDRHPHQGHERRVSRLRGARSAELQAGGALGLRSHGGLVRPRALLHEARPGARLQVHPDRPRVQRQRRVPRRPVDSHPARHRHGVRPGGRPRPLHRGPLRPRLRGAVGRARRLRGVAQVHRRRSGRRGAHPRVGRARSPASPPRPSANSPATTRP